MSNKDEFDVDIDENADEGFDEVSLDEETAAGEQQPAKKKSGAGLVSVIAILAVLGGGTFAAVKFLGVQLPFNIPGVTPTAEVAQPETQAPASDITASADLPQDSLPPQPEVPATDNAGEDMGFGETADAGATDTAAPTTGSSLPNLGISGDSSQDAAINPPWDGAGTTDSAAAPAADTPAADTAATTPADTGNIVDPFAMAGAQQDVTQAVNDAASTAAAGAAPEVVDPFAAVGTAADTAATTQTAPAVTETATAAPAADPAQAARTAELEKKVAELEKSLAAADKALKKANDDLAASQKQLTEKTDALAKAKTDAKSETKAAAKEEAPAKAEPVKAASKPATAKKEAAPAQRKAWVLRSAKPGMAWVSEKGSNEMRTIAVGDTLSGIGKVTAITTDAQGRWMVNGTRGTINQ